MVDNGWICAPSLLTFTKLGVEESVCWDTFFFYEFLNLGFLENASVNMLCMGDYQAKCFPCSLTNSVSSNYGDLLGGGLRFLTAR